MSVSAYVAVEVPIPGPTPPGPPPQKQRAALGRPFIRFFPFGNLERAMRFELTTLTLARLCSTPELRPHPWVGVIYKVPRGFARGKVVPGQKIADQGRARAADRARAAKVITMPMVRASKRPRPDSAQAWQMRPASSSRPDRCSRAGDVPASSAAKGPPPAARIRQNCHGRGCVPAGLAARHRPATRGRTGAARSRAATG